MPSQFNRFTRGGTALIIDRNRSNGTTPCLSPHSVASDDMTRTSAICAHQHRSNVLVFYFQFLTLLYVSKSWDGVRLEGRISCWDSVRSCLAGRTLRVYSVFFKRRSYALPLLMVNYLERSHALFRCHRGALFFNLLP